MNLNLSATQRKVGLQNKDADWSKIQKYKEF